MTSTHTTTLAIAQQGRGYWCALESGMQKGGLRLDSQKHVLPTSIFACANPEVGT